MASVSLTGMTAVDAAMADVAVRQIGTPRGRMSYYDFGGPENAPLLHFAHANGFNGLTYRSILAPLTARFRIIAWDARGHGQSTLPADPQKLRSWNTYSKDLQALVKAIGEPIFLAGHSLGAATSLTASHTLDSLVRGLLLVEPVVPSTILLAKLSAARIFGLAGRVNPLAAKAARRRRQFPNKEAMVASYTGRGAFKTWTNEIIADYVAGGTKPAATGIGIDLSCLPEWEAASFSALPISIARDLARCRKPLIILAAEQGSTCQGLSKIQIARNNPKAIFQRVKGTTHFIPMQQPDLVRHAIIELIEGKSSA